MKKEGSVLAVFSVWCNAREDWEAKVPKAQMGKAELYLDRWNAMELESFFFLSKIP